MTTTPEVPAGLQWYFTHPGAFTHVKDAILAHDPTCASLAQVWTGRTGGVTGLGDAASCEDCGVFFYLDGLLGQYAPGWTTGDPVETDTDGYPADLCACCGQARRTKRPVP